MTLSVAHLSDPHITTGPGGGGRPGAPAGAAWVTHTVPTSAPGVSR
ncbi:hypothetical protein [Streptomyces rubiginosohelvolus]